MSKFKLGDLVEIVQDGNAHPKFVGSVCEVVGLNEYRLAKGVNDTRAALVECYLVWIDGRTIGAHERQLRLIDPPGSERTVIRWAECPWKPNGVTA